MRTLQCELVCQTLKQQTVLRSDVGTRSWFDLREKVLNKFGSLHEITITYTGSLTSLPD